MSENNYKPSGGVDATLESLRRGRESLDNALRTLESESFTAENAVLRDKISLLEGSLAKTNAELDALKALHEVLSRNYRGEMSAKRMALFSQTEARNARYLADGLAADAQKIAQIESDLRASLTKASSALGNIAEEDRDRINAEIVGLRSKIEFLAKEAAARRERSYGGMTAKLSEELSAARQISRGDPAMSVLRKFFKWETFLGLKIVSIVGALLLLLGVFTFGWYMYVKMSAVVQCAAIFILGAIFMAVGELLHRKKWRGGFTIAVTSVGSAVLFLGAALGYMRLHVLPIYAALGICAAVSLISFLAALRYRSQIVAVFALLGGYMPIIAAEKSLVLFCAIYFSILSLFALILSTRKNWYIVKFFGLFAGLIAELSLVLIDRASAPALDASGTLLGAAIGLSLISYMIIPVFGSGLAKKPLPTVAADIILLAGNIAARFLIALLWCGGRVTLFTPLIRNHTFLTVFFALCCFGMALAVKRRKTDATANFERGSLRALFFITGVMYSALTVLYALDTVWFSVGFLIEGAGLFLYGVLRGKRRFTIAGVTLSAFCLIAFLLFNLPLNDDPLFVWQYLSVTLAALLYTALTYRVKDRRFVGGYGIPIEIFRAAAAINLWGYAVYALFSPLKDALTGGFGGDARRFAALIAITAGIALSLALAKIRPFRSFGHRVASYILGAVSIIWLLCFNTVAKNMVGGGAARVVVFVLCIAVNLACVFWVYDLLRFLTDRKKFPIGWTALAVSGFFVLLTTQTLIVQMSLNVHSLIITLVFGVTALFWVLYGFMRRSEATRIAGLALSFAAVLKLLIFDLYLLSTVWKIVAYFVGGAVLLAISFSYQFFNKRQKAAEGGGGESSSSDGE